MESMRIEKIEIVHICTAIEFRKIIRNEWKTLFVCSCRHRSLYSEDVTGTMRNNGPFRNTK